MHRSGLILFCTILATGVIQAAPLSPYADDHDRPLKALSAQEIEELRNGAGMGLARPAELNHYPGPRHVLDLREQLQLTPVQAEATRQLFEAMQRRAIEVGHRILDHERRLEASESELETLLARLGELNGELRYVHLSAHLEQRRILNPGQVEAYDRRRGYTDGDLEASQHGHH